MLIQNIHWQPISFIYPLLRYSVGSWQLKHEKFFYGYIQTLAALG